MSVKCDNCENTFNKNDNKVKCSFCDAVFHSECVTQLTPSLTRTVLETIKKTSGSLTFKCNKCIKSRSMPSDCVSSKLDNLEKYMQEISSQLSNIHKDFANDKKRHENFEKVVVTKINKLEDENNFLRKQLNRSDIIINGLPSKTNNVNLYFIVIEVAKYLGIKLKLSDINFCTWIGKRAAVLVKFNNILTRDIIMKNYRLNFDLTLKKIWPTEEVDSRIYLNDHHTPLVSKFRYYCRKLVINKKILKYEMINWDKPRAKIFLLNGNQEEGDLDYVMKLNLFESSINETGNLEVNKANNCTQQDVRTNPDVNNI